MNKKDMNKKDVEIVNDTINEIGSYAYEVANKIRLDAIKIKDSIRENEKEHFINIDVYNDSIKRYSEKLTRLKDLSVIWYRKKEGLDE